MSESWEEEGVEIVGDNGVAWLQGQEEKQWQWKWEEDLKMGIFTQLVDL